MNQGKPMIRAWLVVAADGFEAVFKDRASAEKYAANTHGIVYPLIVKESA